MTRGRVARHDLDRTRRRPARGAAHRRSSARSWRDSSPGTARYLLHKCAGLTGEQLALRSVPPSNLSLLGLVRHMAKVERRWFRERLAGQDLEPMFDPALGIDADFEDLDPARRRPPTSGSSRSAGWPTRCSPRRRTTRSSPSRQGEMSAARGRGPHDRGVRPAQRPCRPAPRGGRRLHRQVTPGPRRTRHGSSRAPHVADAVVAGLQPLQRLAGDERVGRAGHRLHGEPGASPRRSERLAGEGLQVAVPGPDPQLARAAVRSGQPGPSDAAGVPPEVGERVVQAQTLQRPSCAQVVRRPVDRLGPGRQLPLRVRGDPGRGREHGGAGVERAAARGQVRVLARSRTGRPARPRWWRGW